MSAVSYHALAVVSADFCTYMGIKLYISVSQLLQPEFHTVLQIQKLDGDIVVHQAVQLVGQPRARLRVLQVKYNPQAARRAALLPPLPLRGHVCGRSPCSPVGMDGDASSEHQPCDGVTSKHSSGKQPM